MFPDPSHAGPDELVATGGDLSPSTLVAAYAAGLFPMPVRRRLLGWFCPARRGIIPLDGLIVSRSLRRSLRRYEVRVDHDVGAVIRTCGAIARPHGWITHEFVSAYQRLAELGIAHSVECWADDRLVGGLYGVSIGGFFAGESMFHTAPDASKVALVALVDRLRDSSAGLLDVQWVTPHLATLGAVEISRADYLARLPGALAGTTPDWGRSDGGAAPGSTTPE